MMKIKRDVQEKWSRITKKNTNVTVKLSQNGQIFSILLHALWHQKRIYVYKNGHNVCIIYKFCVIVRYSEFLSH